MLLGHLLYSRLIATMSWLQALLFLLLAFLLFLVVAAAPTLSPYGIMQFLVHIAQSLWYFALRFPLWLHDRVEYVVDLFAEQARERRRNHNQFEIEVLDV